MMSVLFMEGFGQCSTGAQTPGTLKGLGMNWTGWADRGTDVTIAALDSGAMGVKKSIEFPDAPHDLSSHRLSSLPTTIVFGCRVYRFDTNVCQVANFGGYKYFGIHSDGTLRYSRNQGGNLTQAGESWGSTGTIPTGQWSYVEVKITLSLSATGSVEFYIDGSLDSSHTGIQTTRSGDDNYAALVVMGYNGTAASWKFADLYVTDGDVLGPSEVWYQPCDQAGSLAEFTPSAGNNEDNVDETTDPDGDTTYNESSTTGNKDQLGHNITHSFAPSAIQPLGWVRANGDGHAKVRLGVLSGVVESFGDTDQVNDGWAAVRGTIHETDPDGGGAWTATGADDAETVIQHVT